MNRLRIGVVLTAALMALWFAGLTNLPAGRTLASDTTVTTSTTDTAATGTTVWGGNGWENTAQAPEQLQCGDNTALTSYVLWVFTGDTADGTVVTVTIPSLGTYSGTANGDGSWHIFSPWLTTTPTGAFATWTNGSYRQGQRLVTVDNSNAVLTISHGCAPTSTTTTTSTTSTQTTETTPTTTSTTSTQTTETSATTHFIFTTQATSTAQTTTSTGTPQGTVSGITGTPEPTPPATDTVGVPHQASSGSWSLLLAAGAILTLAILILTPARKARRGK